MFTRHVWRLLVFALFLFGDVPVWATPPQYSITEVGSLGGRDNVGYAINNSGDIVGQASTDLSESPTYHAFLYQHDRKITTDLGTLGGPNSLARALNDCEKVAGNSDMDTYGARHAALLTSRTDLGTLGGTVSDAYSINNIGDVVGAATAAGQQWHGALFSHDGTVTDFGATTSLVAINNKGQILGDDTTGTFLLYKGQKTYLSIQGAQILGINDNGDVVGNVYVQSQGTRVPHAFLYHHGTNLDLGTLTPGYGGSSGDAVNDWEEVVGRSDVLPPETHVGVQHAFLYTQHMYDLNTLIAPGDAFGPYVTLTEAVGINCSGWIVANGYDSRGPYGPFPRVYLLTLKGPARKDCGRDKGSDDE